MHILLYTDHRYPAWLNVGSGQEPKEFPSGSAYHLHDLLARGLAEEGHRVSYYCGRGADAAPPEGVTLITGPLPTDVDVCHALAGPPLFADPMLEFGARHSKPCVLTCHMWRKELPGASNWIFVSEALARAHGRDRVVLNGLDPDDYSFSETKDDYVLFLSAMDRAIDKGLDIALALSREKGFRLMVAGTGRTREAIQRTAELCAEAGAEYLGDVRGVRKAELLAGARAVLFPSRLNEGCPLVILEAMMSGTPVISSSSGGSVELVTAESGILCSGEDEWGCAWDRIGSISPLRCREIGVARYHYRRMVRDYLAEYEKERAG